MQEVGDAAKVANISNMLILGFVVFEYCTVVLSCFSIAEIESHRDI